MGGAGAARARRLHAGRWSVCLCWPKQRRGSVPSWGEERLRFFVAVSVIAFLASQASGAAGGATPSADSRAPASAASVTAPDKSSWHEPRLDKRTASSVGILLPSAVYVVYGERCRSARRAVSHYRSLTWERQGARGGTLADRTPIVRSKTCRWARYAAREHQARARSALRSLKRWQRERDRILVGEAAIRAYINDDCLEEIIDRESAGTWSSTVYNYAGSGAYGLPQALPGSKMASAGADWRTNPKTQIRWMQGYVTGRYGSSCGALAFHNANGWY